MSVLFTIELRVACDDDNKYQLAKHLVRQAALQAYGRAALLDDGEKPQVTVYSHDYENGRLDIPLEFIANESVEIVEMSMRLEEALATGCRVRKPVLRVIEGGRSVPEGDTVSG